MCNWGLSDNAKRGGRQKREGEKRRGESKTILSAMSMRIRFTNRSMAFISRTNHFASPFSSCLFTSLRMINYCMTPSAPITYPSMVVLVTISPVSVLR